MVSKEALKKIVMFGYMTDPMLEKLTRVIDVLNFDKEDIIFHEKTPAQRYYMLNTGYIVLEQYISDEVTAIVGSIKPGFSFGWSAMLEGGFYTSDAVCVEPSEVYSFTREKIFKLFEQDPELGLRMYRRLMVIIKKRLDYRTIQFRKAIMNHPDMQRLFGTSEDATIRRRPDETGFEETSPP
jgi:CRP-like cAMP-binding protein